jgi:hypothetical protein
MVNLFCAKVNRWFEITIVVSKVLIVVAVALNRNSIHITDLRDYG